MKKIDRIGRRSNDIRRLKMTVNGEISSNQNPDEERRKSLFDFLSKNSFVRNKN